MSYIGFMENCTKCIEGLFNKCMSTNKYNPSKQDKEEYRNLILQLEELYEIGYIEDKKKYKELMKRIKAADLTNVPELRKKFKKSQANRLGGGVIRMSICKLPNLIAA